jgi:hypothetical protein
VQQCPALADGHLHALTVTVRSVLRERPVAGGDPEVVEQHKRSAGCGPGRRSQEALPLDRASAAGCRQWQHKGVRCCRRGYFSRLWQATKAPQLVVEDIRGSLVFMHHFRRNGLSHDRMVLLSFHPMLL